MDLGTHWINAVGSKANISRYINHSCYPNTEIVVWSFKNNNRAFIVAKVDITKDSWLSFDYNSEYHCERLQISKIPCKCCSNCPNFI